MDAPIDFAIIDGQKSQYESVLNEISSYLAQEFTILVDNANPATGNKTQQVRQSISELLLHTQSDKRFQSYYYPDLGDGVLVLRNR